MERPRESVFTRTLGAVTGRGAGGQERRMRRAFQAGPPARESTGVISRRVLATWMPHPCRWRLPGDVAGAVSDAPGPCGCGRDASPGAMVPSGPVPSRQAATEVPVQLPAAGRAEYGLAVDGFRPAAQ